MTEIDARDLREIATARPWNLPAGAAVLAALLAAIPLVLSRLDGDADLDPFFAALA